MATKTETVIKKWGTHRFSTGVVAGEDYVSFERSFRNALKEQAELGGYELHSFSKNHYCCSAVLREKETGAFAYISLSDVRSRQGDWMNDILYRQMKHAKDWTGGQNHFCALVDLGENLKTLYR